MLLQVVLAVRHCRDRGVLHRDVKAENLLVQTDNLRVKLIDFGCGDLLRESSYRDYSGRTQQENGWSGLLCSVGTKCKGTL